MAAVVALIVVFVAGEAGIDDAPAVAETQTLNAESEDVEAVAQAETLSLALTAPTTCETERGIGGDYATILYDDEGNRTGSKSEYLGHFNVAETPVKWRVTGGTGPYTLVIDGETRDAKRTYVNLSQKSLFGMRLGWVRWRIGSTCSGAGDEPWQRSTITV